jgi:D-tyrosyl-tRNA(Tyr) deacylase
VRAVVQRVSRARVRVGDEVVGEIDRPGVLALVGVTHDDTPERAARLARKIAELRILRRPEGPTAGPDGYSVDEHSVDEHSVDEHSADEHSAVEMKAPVLVVSQFTLYADTRKGRRPSWIAAAPGHVAEPLVDAVVAALRGRGLEVATGRFGADMAVELLNDGPVTLILEV